MTLIKSISGFRGTIGGEPGNNLTPVDIVNFATAFAFFIKQESKKENPVIVVGRDARLSGEMLEGLVNNTLTAMGANVVSLGLSTTPTVEMAVINLAADGGIILTASHNPKQWNALKLVNAKGEFISAKEGESLLHLIEQQKFNYAPIDKIGTITFDDTQIDKHIEKILALDLVDVDAIRKANFKVAVDAVNSTGGISIPPLLKALGVTDVSEIYCEPTGIFPHNPEPLPEHLNDLSDLVLKEKADVGFVVDPDVDRLAIMSESGIPFGEEYTLVAIADYILSNKSGNTVSNLSSTRALQTVTLTHGGLYHASAVGEVNVVEMMKKTNAIIGGEGNGGVIYPELHSGRDALVGIALFLSLMAKRKQKVSIIRSGFPDYFISKNKINLDEGMDVDGLLAKIADKYKHERVTTIDGVKIDFETEWVHLRKSNTEAIIRIYAESNDLSKANHLADKIKGDIGEFLKSLKLNMDFVTLFLIAVGLSLDSFAVSLANGLSIKKLSAWHIFQSSANLALFQGIMPVIGYYLAVGFQQIIHVYDHWIAFILLFLIGSKMIYEGINKKNDDIENGIELSRLKLVAQGIATSIDALAIGVSFAFLEIEILTPAVIIFAVTFIASFIGIRLGKFYGKKLGTKMEILGGIILIGIGFKILIEHLFLH